MFDVNIFSFFLSIASIVKVILFGQFLSYKSGVRTKTSYCISSASITIVLVGGKAVVVP